MPISVRDFESKIIGKLKKLFEVQIEYSRHIKYKIYYKGNYICMTLRSHNAKELADELLKAIKTEMRLNSVEQLHRMKDCTMSALDYLNLLKGKELIK